MDKLNVVVYTMKGCPFCDEFKEMLVHEGIEFYDRDIDEYKEEYDLFSNITESDLIPALLIIEGDEEMAIEPQVNGEDDNEVIMMDEAERKRQKRKRRQMKKIQAATKIEEEEKGEGDNVGAIDSTDKINNPSVNMNKKKKKAKTDSMTSKPISTTGISQSRKASYGL